TGEQDSGAQRAPASHRLGASLWLPAVVAGNLSGRTAIRWHLLPGRELDPGGANARTRKDGSPTPSRAPRSQRHFPISTVSQRPTRTLPRRPSHPLRFSKSEAVNTYKKRCPSKATDFFSRLKRRARQNSSGLPLNLLARAPLLS